MGMIDSINPEDINNFIAKGKVMNLQAGCLEKMQFAYQDLAILCELFPEMEDRTISQMNAIESTIKAIYGMITGNVKREENRSDT